MTRGAHGASLVDLLVGLALAATLAMAGVSAAAVALRLLVRVGARLEAVDVAWLAHESFLFGVRRAGFDPRDAGVAPVAEATPQRLALHADLDGDGVVDASSAEVTVFACDLPGRRLSRIAGGQSLPLASTVVACALEYRDAAGVPLVPPPSGLDAAARARIRRVTLTGAVEPAGGGATAPVAATVALRSAP
jgi:hypothetical protein